MKKGFLIFLIFFVSCEEFWEHIDYDFPNIVKFTVQVDDWYYKINGEIPFSIQNDSICSYFVLIDKNHAYAKQVEGCYGDWTKIFGFTPLIYESHHSNSAMWVEKRYGGKTYICPYTHAGNIVHKQDEIFYGKYTTLEGDTIVADKFGLEVKLEEVYKLEIIDSSGFYIYNFEDQLIAIHGHPEQGEDYYLKLLPYFGGDCPFEGILEDSTIVSEASIFLGNPNKITKEEMKEAYTLSKSYSIRFKQYY